MTRGQYYQQFEPVDSALGTVTHHSIKTTTLTPSTLKQYTLVKLSCYANLAED